MTSRRTFIQALTAAAAVLAMPMKMLAKAKPVEPAEPPRVRDDVSVLVRITARLECRGYYRAVIEDMNCKVILQNLREREVSPPLIPVGAMVPAYFTGYVSHSGNVICCTSFPPAPVRRVRNNPETFRLRQNQETLRVQFTYRDAKLHELADTDWIDIP